jgi:dihydrofolate reductase
VSRLLVAEYLSVDGVAQAPGHPDEDRDGGFDHGGWTAPLMAEHRRYNSELIPAAGAYLLGRRTYDIWAGYWPGVTDPDDEIALALNTRPKYVASTTLGTPAWEGTSVITDVPAEVAALKERSGKPILLLGSPSLAATLAEHDLVDEYQLWIHPVVLGEGKPLFASGGPRRDLALVDCRTTAGGLVVLTYSTRP